jgi:ADP-dependent NAD(P)H-hydrate dehydratase / NAD(P)H-hydrate epimerase
VRATHTITFIALKPGLLTLDGPDHCGELTVAELDLDAQTLLKPNGWVADRALFASGLRPRPRNFHKGMAGSLAVLGGAAGMAGAALLAGRAALRLGAGRVYVGLLDHDAPAVDFAMPEMMLRHPDDALGEELDAVVAGPGIGQGERAETLVAAALASEMPCVLDADALNLMAQNRDLRAACARRAADTLLTPHPAEAARLLGVRTLEIQADRIGAARRISREFGAHVVLKGNGSVIAARDGHWFLNATGNPGMASAGMGDVLSGILGALLAQRYSGEASAVLGVHLHGAAADAQARSAGGAIGLTAGEIIEPARRILNAWLAG